MAFHGLLSFSAALLALVLVTTASAGEINSGDILCKFYTNGMKKCQTKCRALSDKEQAVYEKKRGKSLGHVTAAEATDVAVDPIQSVKCSDSPVSSKWNFNQGFMLFQNGKSVSLSMSKKALYDGSCIFRKDKENSWNCRSCDRGEGDKETADGSCFIGGYMQYKKFDKNSYKMKGSDQGTISIQ